MEEDANQGFPGEEIDEIHKDGFDFFNGTFPLPNIVLLHAGTNDADHAIEKSLTADVEVVATEMINDLRDLLSDLFERGPDM